MKRTTFILSLLLVSTLFYACQEKHSNADSPEESVTQSSTTVVDVPNTLLTDNNNAPTITATSPDVEPIIATVQVISEEEFNQKVFEIDNPKGIQYKGKLPCIVDFYADWCGPCQALNPTLVAFAEEFAGDLIIYKVNTDKSPNIAQALNIESIPTLLLLKPSTQPQIIVGNPGEELLRKAIEETLLSK